MMRSISILLPNLQSGGAERVSVNLANEFAQRGFAVDMVLMTGSGVFLTDLLPEIRVIDLQVKQMRGLIFPLVNYLRTHQPTSLLACMWPLTVIALWSCKLARVNTRLVVAEHNTWSTAEICNSHFTRWLVRTTMRYTFPFVNGIVVVSEGAAVDMASFTSLNRNLITVIYNPVVGEPRPIVTSPLPPKIWWTGSHRRVLAVGTLKAIKDYAMLLRAFALLVQHEDANLLILGEGECRAALEAQTFQLGIEARVCMPGFIKDLTPYYQHADLFVLSSEGEGLPTVIIEALAVGTPVVSTDCPSGPREILADGQFGRLVPVGDDKALAEAMSESLACNHDHVALKARAQDFSVNKAVDQYEAVLFQNSKLIEKD